MKSKLKKRFTYSETRILYDNACWGYRRGFESFYETTTYPAFIKEAIRKTYPPCEIRKISVKRNGIEFHGQIGNIGLIVISAHSPSFEKPLVLSHWAEYGKSPSLFYVVQEWIKQVLS